MVLKSKNFMDVLSFAGSYFEIFKFVNMFICMQIDL